jgi:predicted transcriptional regulator
MQISVLLSIKPEFAGRIFGGTKRYEFRRVLFKNRSVKTVVVYASAPISKVIGEFEVEDILQLEKEHLWNQTKEYSGIPKDYFDTYFEGQRTGYAIKIGNTRLYQTPLGLQENFNVKRAPQSFVYVTAQASD